jgi:hypothetical protein
VKFAGVDSDSEETSKKSSNEMVETVEVKLSYVNKSAFDEENE